jgi:hypothetical protein
VVDHVIGRAKTLPLASRAVATKAVCWPTNSDVLAGASVTDATGVALIVTVALPLTPSTVAVIVAAPVVIAVT